MQAHAKMEQTQRFQQQIFNSTKEQERLTILWPFIVKK